VEAEHLTSLESADTLHDMQLGSVQHVFSATDASTPPGQNTTEDNGPVVVAMDPVGSTSTPLLSSWLLVVDVTAVEGTSSPLPWSWIVVGLDGRAVVAQPAADSGSAPEPTALGSQSVFVGVTGCVLVVSPSMPELSISVVVGAAVVDTTVAVTVEGSCEVVVVDTTTSRQAGSACRHWSLLWMSPMVHTPTDGVQQRVAIVTGALQAMAQFCVVKKPDSCPGARQYHTESRLGATVLVVMVVVVVMGCVVVVVVVESVVVTVVVVMAMVVVVAAVVVAAVVRCVVVVAVVEAVVEAVVMTGPHVGRASAQKMSLTALPV